MQATVIDSFDMKGRVAIDYGATGVVICFNAENPQDAPQQGADLLLIRPDGWMARVTAGELKKCGSHVTLFLANLTRHDIPVGTEVRWGPDFWPTNSERRVRSSPLTHV